MATAEGAKRMHGEITVGTALEIDQSDLEPGHDWAQIGFRRDDDGGAQAQVRS